MTACPLAVASSRTVWSFSAVVTSISAGAATTGRPLIIEGYLMPGTWGSPPTETRWPASEAILRTVSRLVMKR